MVRRGQPDHIPKSGEEPSQTVESRSLGLVGSRAQVEEGAPQQLQKASSGQLAVQSPRGVFRDLPQVHRVQLQCRPQELAPWQKLHGDKVLDDLDQAEPWPWDVRHSPLEGRPGPLAPRLALRACEEQGIGRQVVKLRPLNMLESDAGYSRPQHKGQHQGVGAGTLAKLQDHVDELPRLQFELLLRGMSHRKQLVTAHHPVVQRELNPEL